jgi:carbonic anhydrase
LSAKDKSGDTLVNATIANVKNQMAALKSSSVIGDLIKQGKVKVVGGVYDLETGLVTQVA